MSEFRVPVVRVPGFGKHPNADTLNLTNINGENVIFKAGEFQKGDLAVYVPADAVVPAEVPGTEFLDKYHRRVRPVRLRGIYSEGVLLPISVLRDFIDKREVGEDVQDILKITKHEDPIPAHLSGQAEKDPGCCPVYDIENYKKYKALIAPGERVVITEKLHGTNARYVHLGDERGLMVGSRNHFWKKAPPPLTGLKKVFKLIWSKLTGRAIQKHRDNLYWVTAKELGLEGRLTMYARKLAFYGEIYGQVQDLKYDSQPGQTWFRVFDIYDIEAKRWLDWDRVVGVCKALSLETVPVLYDGPFSHEALEGLVEGKSAIASHFREGVVVKPANTRYDPRHGRVILKWVSETYKLRKNGTEMH